MTCVKTHKPATNKAWLVKDWQDERIQRGLGLEWFTSIDSLFVLSSFKLKFLPMDNPSKIIRHNPVEIIHKMCKYVKDTDHV